MKLKYCAHALVFAGAVLAAGFPTPLHAKDEAKAVDDYNFAAWLYNNGKYAMATESYQDFLKNHPDNEKAPDARFGLAQSLFHQDRFKEASEQYDLLRNKHPDFGQMPELLFQMAQARVGMDRYAEAARLFADLRARFPDHYLADWALAREGACLIIEGKPKDAEPLLMKFLDKYAEPGKPGRKSAATEEMLKRMEKADIKAEDAFMELVERTFFYAALAQFNQEKFKEAGISFKAFTERYPSGKLRDEAKFREAQCLYRQNAFAEAAELYEAATEAGGEFAEAAAFERGLALHKAERLKDASAAFAQMAQRFPDSVQANKARIYSGTLLFDAGDYGAALERLKPFEAQKEIADEAAYWIGMSLLKSGKHADAERQFAESARDYPKSAFLGDMRLGLADARLALGKNDEAAQAFSEFARGSPNSDQAPRALYSAAAALHRAEKYGQSEEICSEFMRNYSSHELVPQVLFLSAENRFLQKSYDQASSQYGALLARKNVPADLAALSHFRLAWVHRYARRFAPALEELAKVDSAAAGKSVADEICYLKGVCLFEEQKYEEAAKSLDAFLKSGNTSRFGDDALLKLGASLMKQKQPEAAKTAFGRLVKEHPKSDLVYQAHYRIAECCYDLRQYDAAIANYSKAADQKTPDELTPYAVFGLALCYYDQEVWADAAKNFDHLAVQFKESELAPQALYRKGISLMKLEKWKDSESAFRSLAGSLPKHELARASLMLAGSCLQEQKNWSEAAKVFQAVIDDYPPDKDQPRALYELAWSWREAGEEENSLAAFRKLADKFPADPLATDALFYLAEAKYKTPADQEQPDAAAKRTAAARALYAQALASSKDKRLADKSLYRIGWCDWTCGNHASAAAEFDKIRQDFPESDLMPDALFQAGQAYARIGKHETAAERFHELLDNPKHAHFKYIPEARLGLGEAKLALGQAAQAEELLADWLKHNAEHSAAAHATFLLGRSKYDQKNYAGALASFNAVPSLTRSELAAQAQFYSGQALQAQGDFNGAVKAYLRVEALYPDVAEWVAASMFEKGKCYDALDNKDEAVKTYREVAETYRGTKWAELAAGRLK